MWWGYDWVGRIGVMWGRWGGVGEGNMWMWMCGGVVVSVGGLE